MPEPYRQAANALVESAEVTPLLSWLMNYETRGKFDFLVKFMKDFSGGLWVGGWLEILPDRIRFIPNLLNKAVVQDAPEIAIYYSEMVALSVRRTFVSDVLSISLESQTIKFRVRKADRFAEQVDLRRLPSLPIQPGK